MVKIVNRLLKIRKAKGITQTELSEMTGMSQKALSDLERGKSKGVTFKTIALLCNVLEVTMDQLFKVVPEEDPEESLLGFTQRPDCSFCGENENNVPVLIIGRPNKSKPKVYICSDCVKKSAELMKEKKVKGF